MGKYTISINPEVDRLLNDLGATDPEQKASLIQKALASYIYLRKESDSPGLSVSITDADRNIIKNVELP